MYPSNRNEFSVTLNSLSEIVTLNDAVGRLTKDVDPELVPGIETDMAAVTAAANLAPTVDNAYTLLTGETDQNPNIAVNLTPGQVEIARLALIFAAKKAREPLESNSYADMAREIQATAELSEELNC